MAAEATSIRAATRGPTRRVLGLLGPAVIVSVGYMDPGNWATDLEAGSRFGYTLLWVLLAANLAALLLQHLSAKLGLATGLTYPELCRREFPRPLVLFLWVTAELAAMATDLAEFLGAALGFYLLFAIPLFPAALLAAVVVFVILALYRFGHRSVEIAIFGLVAVIGVGYLFEVWLVQPDWGAVASGVVTPNLPMGALARGLPRHPVRALPAPGDHDHPGPHRHRERRRRVPDPHPQPGLAVGPAAVRDPAARLAHGAAERHGLVRESAAHNRGGRDRRGDHHRAQRRASGRDRVRGLAPRSRTARRRHLHPRCVSYASNGARRPRREVPTP